MCSHSRAQGVTKALKALAPPISAPRRLSSASGDMGPWRSLCPPAPLVSLLLCLLAYFSRCLPVFLTVLAATAQGNRHPRPEQPSLTDSSRMCCRQSTTSPMASFIASIQYNSASNQSLPCPAREKQSTVRLDARTFWDGKPPLHHCGDDARHACTRPHCSFHKKPSAGSLWRAQACMQFSTAHFASAAKMVQTSHPTMLLQTPASPSCTLVPDAPVFPAAHTLPKLPFHVGPKGLDG